MSSPREICIAYVNDYLDHREPWWNSNLQKASAKVINDKPSARRQACDELIKDILSADSPVKVIRLAAKLGRFARETQREKAEKSGIFAFASLVTSYLSLTDSDPLFAKTLHAIRTALIKDTKTTYRREYLEEVVKRKNEVKAAEDVMAVDIKNKVSTKDSRAKRDNLFNELLDLQDESTITFAHIHSQFPVTLPPDDWRPFRLPPNVSTHPEIPLVYDDHYDTIYYWNEIHHNDERRKKFTELLRQATHKVELETKLANKSITNPLQSLLSSESAPASPVPLPSQSPPEEKKSAVYEEIPNYPVGIPRPASEPHPPRSPGGLRIGQGLFGSQPAPEPTDEQHLDDLEADEHSPPSSLRSSQS